MKKVILISLIFIFIITCFVGCKKDEEWIMELSSVKFFSYIPNEFTFENELYRRVDPYDIDFPSEKKIVGYLINSEDLEKWKAIDNDDTITYATSQERVEYKEYHTYRKKSGYIYEVEYDDDEFLLGGKYYKEIKNRFELFAYEGFDDYLVIEGGFKTKLFKIIKEEENIE